jgi:Arc/MetJ-type ribon-helix-helix transcriptional regulator
VNQADGASTQGTGNVQSAEDLLTPAMIRLGAAELETVDTLIIAGAASSRAETVRWALTRIRERPAYERLRKRAGEIERLKAEF